MNPRAEMRDFALVNILIDKIELMRSSEIS